jgi:murein L,D-transpeptidase YcbB/YkuD
MTKPVLQSLCLFLLLAVMAGSCQMKKRAARNPLEDQLKGAINRQSNLPFDSNLLISFFRAYPELHPYEKDVATVYREHHFRHIWFDTSGVVEFGNSLYTKVKEIKTEGVSSGFPYLDILEGVFEKNREYTLTPTETELMLTSLYLFYADKVYKGVDEDTTRAIGWLLPRKQLSYTGLLDSIMSDTSRLNRDDNVLYSQYYKLRDVLLHYREIEKKGGWDPIVPDPKFKGYKPGDTAKAILQIRERLFVTGDIKVNNGSKTYDPDLAEAVKKYQLRNGYNPDEKITPKLITEMNVPISERITKIIVNMERCRWISPDFAKAKEYIVVNIPSFKLTLVRTGQPAFESPVVVGALMTKTVIFSGMLSYIVFSPYWNLPPSIINKEVKPGMAKNKNYLEAHNMEWNEGRVRQKPGKSNSLGLVKFIFPNSDDIYMHDTPAKSLFARESRAFSHGCIRVGKPKEFAIEILKEDPAWTSARIDAAMHAGKESSYTLKTKIPVYIGYLTAWVNDQGEINFYNDIYKRDGRLAKLLMDDK